MTNARMNNMNTTISGIDPRFNPADSIAMGDRAELSFRQLRGDKIVREATRDENIYEHWDLLDSELGRLDVKSHKVKDRRGNVPAIWWEVTNVRGNPGWGRVNKVERLIAIPIVTNTGLNWYCVDPADVEQPLKDRTSGNGPGRGIFQWYQRKGRRDWMVQVPPEFIREFAQLKISSENQLTFRSTVGTVKK